MLYNTIMIISAKLGVQISPV